MSPNGFELPRKRRGVNGCANLAPVLAENESGGAMDGEGVALVRRRDGTMTALGELPEVTQRQNLAKPGALQR